MNNETEVLAQVIPAILKLIDSAQNANKSEDALRFSQAACNVANAYRSQFSN